MPKHTRMKAPPGTDEANHGTERYRVDNDGAVEVPTEAVEPLRAVGGFVEMADQPAVPDGRVRVMHEDDEAGCSYGGESFERQADGSFLVPAAAVADLLAHGFVAIDEA